VNRKINCRLKIVFSVPLYFEVESSVRSFLLASPFIHSLLLDVEDVHENEFCIILPDFTSKQLEGLVDIMHSGHFSNYSICIIMLMKYSRGDLPT